VIGPHRIRRIDRNQIPQNSGSLTAFFLGLEFIPIRGELFREDVVRIPILLDAPVWNEIERKRRWRRPVSREDRLPDHEHPRGDIRIAFQDRCDCGRPPQTGRSCRRQQNDQSNGILRAIEVGAECFERSGVEVNEWGLAGRRVVRAELPVPEYRGGDDDDEHDDRRSFERHQGNHAATMAAITCGNTATSTTIAAETARIAIDPRFRVEHCRCARDS